MRQIQSHWIKNTKKSTWRMSSYWRHNPLAYRTLFRVTFFSVDILEAIRVVIHSAHFPRVDGKRHSLPGPFIIKTSAMLQMPLISCLESAKRPNATVLGTKLAAKVSRSRPIPAYFPEVSTVGWPLISALRVIECTTSTIFPMYVSFVCTETTAGLLSLRSYSLSIVLC